MTNCLWLHKPQFSSNQKFALQRYMEQKNISTQEVFFWNPAFKIRDMIKHVGKRKKIFNPAKKKEFENALQEMVDKLNPKIIVCNDENLCEFFTENRSLNLCRGFVYRWRDIPVLIVDDYLAVHGQKWAGWLLLNDLAKLRRWMDGKQRNEPAFQFSVCSNLEHLRKVRAFYSDGSAIIASVDIETASSFITSISFTLLRKDGKVHTFIIPFYSTQTTTGCYWKEVSDEVLAWEIVKEICEGPITLTFQNGQYDCAWLLRYNIAPCNYYLDSLHLFHSIWCEAPKKLNNIAAFCLDFAQFWKDESKGDKQDVKKYGRVPITLEGYIRYLRYNGLDTHYTLHNTIFLLLVIVQPAMKWALQNYISELKDQIGPAMSMSMTGLKTDKHRIVYKRKEANNQHKSALKDFRTMCADPEINPNSSDEVASLIYDVLGAQPIKTKGKIQFGPRSVDKRVLRLVRTQHPFFAKYIDKLWETKEPLNNLAKYLNAYYPGWRFLYQFWAAGTETSRYSGKNHNWWYGTNPQNIPDHIRDMFVADPGKFFFSPDYSQADAWFVAFESLDPTLIEELESDRDAHCVLSEFIFKEPYEKIYAAYKRKDPWAVDPIEGRRQNSKRVRHGANYRMGGFALYLLMGREAVVATARALGENQPWAWDQKRLVQFCSVLLAFYYKRYGRIPKWFDETAKEAILNGNRATCFGGYTRLFFGNIAKDENIQRELSAFFGQGGTGGLMRRSALNIYYKSGLMQDGLQMMTQTHDSFKFQIPDGRFDLCEKVLTIMEEPCTIGDRTFIVPTDAKCGRSWGGSMMDWSVETTMEDIDENERLWVRKNYPELEMAA